MKQDITELALQLDALGHPIRLKAVALLFEQDLYLAEIAQKLEISRALAKIHLKKLEGANIVDTRVVLVKDQAKALRYYHLKDFSIKLSPKEVSDFLLVAERRASTSRAREH